MLSVGDLGQAATQEGRRQQVAPQILPALRALTVFDAVWLVDALQHSQHFPRFLLQLARSGANLLQITWHRQDETLATCSM